MITGCSTGIGYDAAKTMRAAGWRVFASCRKQEDCNLMVREGFESPRIDYCDVKSIETGLGEVLSATEGCIDALFNNGARGLPGAIEDIPTDGLRDLMESNLIGWHDLTRRVVPIMRDQGYGRIVLCSSVLGYVPMRYRGAYVATKYALEGWADCLRIELRDTQIYTCLIEPGPITSALRRNNAAQFFKWIDWENSHFAANYRATLVERFDETESSPDAFELPASAVSSKLLKAATATRPRARYYVTAPAYVMGYLRRLLPTVWLDWLIAKG